MRITFPYRDLGPLDVPGKNLLGVFSPSIVEVRESVEQIIDRALSNPIGSEVLTRLLKGGKRVLIVVDDYTRSTPVQEILPRLIKELQHAGVNKEDINILVALGTHRPMTEEEMVEKFGPKLSKQYPILNHSWWDPSQLISLGETEKGTPILVNRMVKEVISSSVLARSFRTGSPDSAVDAILSSPESAERKRPDEPIGSALNSKAVTYWEK